MKTVLAVIAFFFISAVQAQVAPATTEGALGGLPMNVAKKLDLKPVLANAGAGSKLSGMPMSRAKLLAEPTRVAPEAHGGDVNAQLGGVLMALAKRL